MTLVIVLLVSMLVPLLVVKWLQLKEGLRRDRERGTSVRTPAAPLPSFERTRVVVQLFITVVGILGGGYIIISGDYSPNAENWAAGLIGGVFGFWLK